MNIVMTCLFGIEALVAGEVKDLGYKAEQIKVQDGQVILQLEDFQDVKIAVAKLNYWLRTAERIFLELTQFKAEVFDELYDQIYAFDWQSIINPEAKINVSGYSRKSKLFSISSCQSISKKAITQKLLKQQKKIKQTVLIENEKYGVFSIQLAIVNDLVHVLLDTSGVGLHKRGYRPLRNLAPIKETLAAALIILSKFERGYDRGEVLLDPCCGAGTIPIEAAMILKNIAPGLKRHFASERHQIIGKAIFDREREFAKSAIKEKIEEPVIFGADIDRESLKFAQQNAERAGVEDALKFANLDLFKTTRQQYESFINHNQYLMICNPPYGERLFDQQRAERLYKKLGEKFLSPGTDADRFCRVTVISPDQHFEDVIGYKARKKRKLYNGNIRCDMYHYF